MEAAKTKKVEDKTTEKVTEQVTEKVAEKLLSGYEAPKLVAEVPIV